MRVLVGLLLALGLLAAGLLVVLPHAAPGLLAWQLRSLGLEDSSIRQVAIGPHSAILDDVHLAPGLSAQRVILTYAPSSLIRGRLGDLRIEGLRTRLRYDPERGLGITGLEHGEGGAGSPALPFLPDRIRIDDAVLQAVLPGGTLEIEAEARLEIVPDDVDRFEVEIRRIDGDVAGGSVAGRLTARGEFQLEASDPLTTLQARARATLQASGLEVGEARLAMLEASLDLALDGAVLAVGLDQADARVAQAGPGGALAAVGGAWPVEISLEAGAGPMLVLDLRQRLARLATSAHLSAGGPSADLAIDLAVAAPDGLARPRVEDLALELEVQDLVPGPRLDRLRLSLAGHGAWDEARLLGSLDVSGGGTFGGTGANELELRWPLVVDVAPDRVEVGLDAAGSLLLAGLVLPEIVSEGRARLSLPPGPVLALERRAPQTWRLTLPVRIEDVEVAGAGRRARGGSGELGITAAGRGTTPETVKARLARGTLRLPDAGIGLAGVEAEGSWRAGAAPGELTFDIETVRSLAAPAIFAPFAARGVIRPEPDRVRFESTLGRSGIELRIDGYRRLDRAEGQAQVDLRPVRFAPGDLQPGDLVAGLAGLLEEVAGELSLAGVVQLDRPDLASDLGLIVEDLGFVLGPVRVEDLRGVITFDQLMPPASAPEQMLSIGLIDFGLTFTRGRTRFELLPGGPLEVARLTFAWAGGDVAARPFTVGSADGVISVTLEARGLDLGRIFAEVRLPGLEGEGTIDGVLPVRIADGEASIEHGRLAARRAGWLRYRPEDPPDALAAGGESMSLLLQALEDFRYDELEITLDGRTDRAMDIRLHLKGANPDLYGGHPVEFNLNLEGELANILRQGLKSYTLPERVRERIERSRSR